MIGKKGIVLCILFLQSFYIYADFVPNHSDIRAKDYVQDIQNDFKNYFHKEKLIYLADSLIISGVLANTGLDSSIRKLWRVNIKGPTSNRFFKGPEYIGGISWVSFPMYFMSMAVGELGNEFKYHFGGPLYEWGYRNLRASILGGLQQVIFTHAIGSVRPCKNANSNWRPFNHKTGVSGHAFYGALPFLTAAHMTNPQPLRYLLIAASALPGIARINSDAHYASQVIMGWSLAYLSSVAVYETSADKLKVSSSILKVSVLPYNGGGVLVAKLNF